MEQYLDSDVKEEYVNQPTLYKLQAVAVHLGTIYGGHYVAYVKKEDDNWYCTNDERVGRVS